MVTFNLRQEVNAGVNRITQGGIGDVHIGVIINENRLLRVFLLKEGGQRF